MRAILFNRAIMGAARPAGNPVFAPRGLVVGVTAGYERQAPEKRQPRET